MNEKKQISISLSTLLLIIALIIIIVMGVLIYQLFNNNNNELNSEISNLEAKIDELNLFKNTTTNNSTNTASSNTMTSATTTSENDSSKILSNISKIEISVLDETSTEGIMYTKPVTITNQSEINTLLDMVNSSTLYPDSEFYNDYGAFGFIEDLPFVDLYTSSGDVIHLRAWDNFDLQKKLNILTISKSEDNSDSEIYKTTSNVQEYLENLYNTYK